MTKPWRLIQNLKAGFFVCLLLSGLGLGVASFTQNARACDISCFSIPCTGTCITSQVYCTNNCIQPDECLQEVGFCTSTNNPCLCGICTDYSFCP
jgi:hypothetical protein